ncbi:MAG: hypothetical protein LN568_05640 [Rickettsia endosymbiont of Pseudomimeciton antennatum]|nr:hypothetical protein [Rickettsia endosymbiont of Pseudomimeciton antennatum]
MLLAQMLRVVQKVELLDAVNKLILRITYGNLKIAEKYRMSLRGAALRRCGNPGKWVEIMVWTYPIYRMRSKC